jgi:hypothetical protein
MGQFSRPGEEALIDVFFEQEKQFEKIYRRSIKRRSHKTTLRVASLQDLEKMKKESGRPIDFADITLIREIKKIRKPKK